MAAGYRRQPLFPVPRLGYTILEIGIVPKFRGKGYGIPLVRHAENAVQAQNRYVCAYGPAEGFWQKCGYRDSGELASNGLKLYIK
ncbi:MAG: GNAT family N-acetyltransferase [Oscillospiraceae bacterium]|nr:GNAT family N-acetyltransferase [Oscillospiraceae bacterium]